MFKGMQKRLVWVCLLVLFIAPVAQAGDWGDEVSPWRSFTLMLSDIFERIHQGLNDTWANTFEGSESGEPPAPDPAEGDPPQNAEGEPPGDPSGGGDDDGDSNEYGPGTDPWG